MSYLIKDLPLMERPRERFKNYGVESLSNEELLSILLRCGSKSKSVCDLSFELLRAIPIHDFANANYNELKSINGIGDVKAMVLLSAIEFGKRVLSKRDMTLQIRTSLDVYNFVKEKLENELQEKFLVLFLDTRKFIILEKIMFVGTVNNSTVHPRDVFREAVKCNAVSIIIIHNHPAGSVVPSMQDIRLTNEFIKIGKLIDIKVLDHLIIGKNDFYSFLERNGDLFAIN